jgi:hypothetical protein
MYLRIKQSQDARVAFQELLLQRQDIEDAGLPLGLIDCGIGRGFLRSGRVLSIGCGEKWLRGIESKSGSDCGEKWKSKSGCD